MFSLSKIYPSIKDVDTSKLRCWLELNLSAVKQNVKIIQSLISDKMELMAVVKANCYGYGSITIANYLESIGVKFFAVATLQEAINLRTIGKITGEILLLSWTPVSEKETLIKYNLIQTLVDYEYAKKLNELPGIVKCHIKVDTGMNRIGHKIQEIETFKKMFELKNLNISRIYSHLCRVREFREDSDNYTKMQLENFKTIINQLEKDGYNLGYKHIMNSLGILRFNDKQYDLVRSATLLYGVNPEPNNKEMEKIFEENHFKPFASFKCKVMSTKIIEKGEKISYGSLYTAKEKIRIAPITVGYADGFPFALFQNGFSVIIKGNLCPIVGRVCMDCTIVKIPMDSDIKEGDIVTIFGFDENGNPLNYKEFFLKAGKIYGETICQFSERITKIYHL